MNDVPPARHADESPIVSAAPVGLESTRVERASLAINAFLSAIVALTAGIVEVACWAHARRKFYEARNSDPARSAQALAYIRLLYDVEDQAKEKHLDAAARAALRQQLALPRLSQFKAWLEAQQLSEGGGVLPKSPMGEAITYALNQYNALCVYVSDGDLAIDNNAGENALRRIGPSEGGGVLPKSPMGEAITYALNQYNALCVYVSDGDLAIDNNAGENALRRIGVGRNYAQRDYAECGRSWPHNPAEISHCNWA